MLQDKLKKNVARITGPLLKITINSSFEVYFISIVLLLFSYKSLISEQNRIFAYLPQDFWRDNLKKFSCTW